VWKSLTETTENMCWFYTNIKKISNEQWFQDHTSKIGENWCLQHQVYSMNTCHAGSKYTLDGHMVRICLELFSSPLILTDRTLITRCQFIFLANDENILGTIIKVVDEY
jgi:hypothetical protein